MRSSRTIKKSLVIKIHGIDSEKRLHALREAAYDHQHIIVLDNDAVLSVKPGGTTFHYCIEGKPANVDDVIHRLTAGKNVSCLFTKGGRGC